MIGQLILAGILGVIAITPSFAQNSGPRVLSIQAHHDDETMYAASLYAIANHLDGAVDVVVITDGSGGFDYAMLAEPIYDKPLATEPEARTYLPAVRKQEMLAGGHILGLRNVFFLDEYDHGYTLDVDTTLQHVWDAAHVRNHLGEILEKGDYDFVFTLLPTEDTHGHHKGATILGLQAVMAMPEADRPVVLGGLAAAARERPAFKGLDSFRETATLTDEPPLRFDRRRPLEVDSLLTYQVVVNWLIAEHKSQGTLQLLVNEWDLEHFWIYSMNEAGAGVRARDLFDRLLAWRP